MHFAEPRHREWLSKFIHRVEIGVGNFNLSFRTLLVKTLQILASEHEASSKDASRIHAAMFMALYLFDTHIDHLRINAKFYGEFPTRFDQTTSAVLRAATSELMKFDQQYGSTDNASLEDLFRRYFALSEAEAKSLVRQTIRRLDAAKDGPTWAEIERQIAELEAQQSVAA